MFLFVTRARYAKSGTPLAKDFNRNFFYLDATGITKRSPAVENSQAGRLCWSEDC